MSMLSNFGRHEVNPRINKPDEFKQPKKVPLAQSPVVARIRKTQFNGTTSMPSGINVKEVSQTGTNLLKAAPKLQIKKL